MKSTTSEAKLTKYRGTYLHLGSKRQCQITEGGSENSLFKSFGSLQHNPDKKNGNIFNTCHRDQAESVLQNYCQFHFIILASRRKVLTVVRR